MEVPKRRIEAVIKLSLPQHIEDFCDAFVYLLYTAKHSVIAEFSVLF